jgi:hypothetical protein
MLIEEERKTVLDDEILKQKNDIQKKISNLMKVGGDFNREK